MGTEMKRLAICLTGLLLAGCDIPQQAEVGPRAIPVEDTTRFNVESHGTFNAGYSSHEREILVITDAHTGKKYIGITGVGVTELWAADNTTNEE